MQSSVSKSGTYLLGVYSYSFKNFKNGFFRVVINLVNRSHFFNENGDKKFLFYWTNNLLRYKKRPKDILFEEYWRIISILEQLSKKFPTKNIVTVTCQLGQLL